MKSDHKFTRSILSEICTQWVTTSKSRAGIITQNSYAMTKCRRWNAVRATCFVCSTFISLVFFISHFLFWCVVCRVSLMKNAQRTNKLSHRWQKIAFNACTRLFCISRQFFFELPVRKVFFFLSSLPSFSALHNLFSFKRNDFRLRGNAKREKIISLSSFISLFQWNWIKLTEPGERDENTLDLIFALSKLIQMTIFNCETVRNKNEIFCAEWSYLVLFTVLNWTHEK